jgi:hypothetical protein
VSERVSTVKVLPSLFVVGGWKGEISISGDIMNIVGEDPAKKVTIDAKNLKRAGFNGANGLWIFTLKSGGKIRLQGSGSMLSADRTQAGWETNAKIGELLRKHGIKGFRI